MDSYEKREVESFERAREVVKPPDGARSARAGR